MNQIFLCPVRFYSSDKFLYKFKKLLHRAISSIKFAPRFDSVEDFPA